MAVAVQQSLFEAGGETPMVEAARWMEGVMLGEISLGLCVIAVAFVGALLLSGRLPLREGARIVAGSFVLLGAPVIAEGFADAEGAAIKTTDLPPVAARIIIPRPDLPVGTFDPYAGASLRKD